MEATLFPPLELKCMEAALFSSLKFERQIANVLEPENECDPSMLEREKKPAF